MTTGNEKTKVKRRNGFHEAVCRRQWSRFATTGLMAFCCFAVVMIFTCTENTATDENTPDGTVTFEDHVPVPEGWEGVWEITIDELDEETEQLHVKTVWTDTLHAGDTISARLGSLLSDCEGHIAGDSLVFKANNSWTEKICDVKLVIEINALRTDDSLSGEGEWRIETSGTCGDAKSVEGRELIKLSGKRTATLSSGK